MSSTVALPATTDLCDAHEGLLNEGVLQVMRAGTVSFGTLLRFAGPASTVRVHEDNSRVGEAVKTPGEGRVLVIDGGGSLRCALLGGNLARAAADNGWAGIVVDGAVRDADEIDTCAIGVRALGVCPRRSVKRGTGERDVSILCLDAAVRPGDWIYADRDGILVSRRPLHVT